MSEIKTEHGIFVDLIDRNGNVVKTAQEYYEWWLEQNKIGNCLEVKSNQELTEELTNAQIYITELELQNLEISMEQENINQRLLILF